MSGYGWLGLRTPVCSLCVRGSASVSSPEVIHLACTPALRWPQPYNTHLVWVSLRRFLEPVCLLGVGMRGKDGGGVQMPKEPRAWKRGPVWRKEGRWGRRLLCLVEVFYVRLETSLESFIPHPQNKSGRRFPLSRGIDGGGGTKITKRWEELQSARVLKAFYRLYLWHVTIAVAFSLV